ncbi:RIO1 family regulatory kinase/ATPase domain-containing protein [Demequina iriomotensis]|uniref:RIO1 family regulatory kinase/ATPase domain-containing protein n=1 Tax=Demequina iriomotensis TaxID=1536641 RepID=UPI000A6F8409|nr:RIO1 family regulatory kinase/ATPase [Demequina iriomotensis]
MRQVTPLRLDRVARAVGSGDRDERLARARFAALSAIDHPGVCAPVDVVREDDAVVVHAPRVAGTVLADVGRCESLGEWAWLVRGIAEALAALHAAGLAHGDLSPSNVIVGSRPVLIDLVGAALGRERGTPGFASPERAAGGPPTAADDVHALGALALAAASASITTEAEAWAGPLLAADPGARPTAGAVARGIDRCAAPVRWQPSPDPVTAAAPAAVRTVSDPRAWHWRLRRHPWRGAAVLAALALLGGWWVWGPEVPAVAGLAARGAPEASARSSLPDAGAAARAVTLERADALARADPEALVALAVPGSSAWAAAEREARALREGARVDGLAVEVGATEVVEVEGGRAVVDVAYVVAAHTWRGADGELARTPAHAQRIRMLLVWSGERWRVEDVSARP